MLVAALGLLGACGGPPDDELPPEAAGPAAADTVISPIDEALARAQRIEEGLPYGAAQVRRVDVDEHPPRTVRLWRDDGRPIKIEANEPDEAGRLTSHALFYFHEGELFFVRDRRDRFVFRDGRLDVWLDDELDTLRASPDALAERERALRHRADQYLAAFDEQD